MMEPLDRHCRAALQQWMAPDIKFGSVFTFVEDAQNYALSDARKSSTLAAGLGHRGKVFLICTPLTGEENAGDRAAAELPR
jgi:hypothetical protein